MELFLMSKMEKFMAVEEECNSTRTCIILNFKHVGTNEYCVLVRQLDVMSGMEAPLPRTGMLKKFTQVQIRDLYSMLNSRKNWK